MHILLQSITPGKDNQTMKFCQLVEYIAWETFFLEIFCTKCSGETILRPFSKKSILSISLGQYSLKLYTVSFLFYATLSAIEILETRLQITYLYLI